MGRAQNNGPFIHDASFLRLSLTKPPAPPVRIRGMFWEYFVNALRRGYVVVPYPNPPPEFVAIHVSWVIGAMLAFYAVCFYAWYLSRARRAKKSG